MFEDIYETEKSKAPDLSWDYRHMTKEERTRRTLNILRGRVKVTGKEFWEHEVFNDDPEAIVKSLKDFIDFIEDGFQEEKDV